MVPRRHGFLRNCWYVAAWDHELIDGKLLAAHAARRAVLLYRGDSGQVVALDMTAAATAARRCPRAGAKVTACAACTTASSSTPTGKCMQIPGQDMIPPKLGVSSYPVVERDHLVWIWMGEPARPIRRRSSTSRT